MTSELKMKDTRTDVHAPKALNPSDYRVVAVTFPDTDWDGNTVIELDVLDEAVWDAYESGSVQHFAGTKNFNAKNAPTRCDHCGTRIKYAVYLLHLPSNEVIVVGRQCSTVRFSDKDWDLRKSKARVRSHRENALSHLASNGYPEVAEWFRGRCRLTPYKWAKSHFGNGFTIEIDGLDPDWAPCRSYDHSLSGRFDRMIGDGWSRDKEYQAKLMRRRDSKVAEAEASAYGCLRQYSEAVLDETGALALSPEWLVAAIDRVEDAILAQVPEDKPEQPKAPCPTGRVRIKGTVLSTKEVENSFGYYRTYTTKALVESETGFRVWGTALYDWEKGMAVEFTATVKPSDTDAAFGFYTRPFA